MGNKIFLLLIFATVSIAHAQTVNKAARELTTYTETIDKSKVVAAQKNLIVALNLNQDKKTDSIKKVVFLKDTVVLEHQHQALLTRFSLKKNIVPILLITYGGFSVENPHIKNFNSSWKNEIASMRMPRNHADDYTQFAPMAIVYGLNFAGVKGNNDIGDIITVNITSFLLSTAIVRPLKQLTAVKRPDGSNDHSFPSGHTSTAFVSAQFMYREYRGKDRLLSLMGYPFAVYTALYRTVNDKHWFGDVVAGAGIGILSTELAYFLLPHMKNMLKKISKSNAIAYPFYQDNAYGLGVQVKL
ncbi:phosphatase PAP2 family protein [Pedobacter xixiisoli]|uniref:PAP2 superfamily protein n=1 Tax=Pedobacter xixiisoli TaxID=1476464 RepID=A0A286ADL7_9SPHI|nr:phosphatase PAP2 family protein [Pedobacter xixiisoli]SOD20009.1 PAP2 superfamily protein [Pedobacter xixiisoli]